MLLLMGWRIIQTWAGIAIAPETRSREIARVVENLRQIQQHHFLERRSLL
ncbi:MAG: hypothetical protein J7647_31425 [Cyanobacteria bacterium SBLK]|nr:hypothetical protein [Cyanobacteria bacterium SBLK]